MASALTPGHPPDSAPVSADLQRLSDLGVCGNRSVCQGPQCAAETTVDIQITCEILFRDGLAQINPISPCGLSV